MRTRFDFCHSAGALTPDTTFVAVWFGQSKRDQAIMQRLQPLRFQRDIFFERHNAQVAEFINRVAASLFPGCSLPLLRLKTRSMSASDFLRYLTDAELMPKSPSQSVFHTLQHIDPRFYAKTLHL